jgi:hypothetical protein
MLTTRLTLHLNGGSKFSERHEDILADGEPTGMTMHTRTDGSPEYRITVKEIHDGDATLDMLDPDSDDAETWVWARLAARSTPTTAPEAE